MKKDRVICCYLDNKTYKKFKNYCQNKDKSMSKILRNSIKIILEKNKIDLTEIEQLTLF